MAFTMLPSLKIISWSEESLSRLAEIILNKAPRPLILIDGANGENGGTIESITAFADWWDSLLTPLFLEEEPWKYVVLIVSGSKSDLNSNKLKLSI